MTQPIQWTKPVCQLDSDGLYLGQTEAELDVYARDGGYIIPGGCIEAEPPAPKEGHAARWTGTAWEYLPDHRGQTAYRIVDGQAVTVDTVGELPGGLTFDAPPSVWHTWDGLKWSVSKEAAAEQLAQAKAAKLVEINAAAQSCVYSAAELDKVPEFEADTWTIQKLEAEAWAADNNAATPVLSRIADERGVDVNKLRAAALRKANYFTLLTASVAGQRQALADKLNKAKTVKAVDEISISFTAPTP